MRWLNHILIFLMLFVCFLGGFLTGGDAAPPVKTAAVPGQSQTLGELSKGLSPMQEHKVALDPFYRLQSNGPRVWMERILVTFIIEAPKNILSQDFNNPAFRKMFYELLQSGDPEAAIQAQAVERLKQQVGTNIDPRVKISRSVLIVR